jgi:hypothetical protein
MEYHGCKKTSVLEAQLAEIQFRPVGAPKSLLKFHMHFEISKMGPKVARMGLKWGTTGVKRQMYLKTKQNLQESERKKRDYRKRRFVEHRNDYMYGAEVCWCGYVCVLMAPGMFCASMHKKTSINKNTHASLRFAFGVAFPLGRPVFRVDTATEKSRGCKTCSKVGSMPSTKRLC